MLENKLNSKFYKHYKESSLEPIIILCHPHTLYDLINEISKYVDADFTSSNIRPGSFTYRGVKVYRSPDVEVGEFIVK